MSTFSHCNGPGCNSCGSITPPELSKLKQDLESLKASFNQLNIKLANYPDIDKTNINEATIKTLTILEKLIATAGTITVGALNVTGAIKSGNIDAPNITAEGKVKAGNIEGGQIVSKGDASIAGQLNALGKSILKELEATNVLFESLVLNKSLTVKDGARIEKVLEVLEKIVSHGKLEVTDNTRVGSLTVLGGSSVQGITGTAAAFSSLVLNTTLRVLGTTTLADVLTNNIVNSNDIETLTAKVKASLTTNSIISNEPISKNLLSYTHGTTIKLYHLCQEIPDQPPYYLGGNEHAHFTFYAERHIDLPKHKYFYTEQGRREILTGMTALVLKKDERLDPNGLEDVPGIYKVTVVDDNAVWELQTNVVAPSKHSTNGWKFHIEFIEMPNTDNTTFAHEFVLVWLPYSADVNTVDVGHQDYNLTLHSQTRPKVNEHGALHHLAYLSDLINSILYQGGATYYATDITSLPALNAELPINSDLSKKHKVIDGETAVVIAANEDKVAIYYKLINGAWTEYGKLEHDKQATKYAYQWNIDYLIEGTDTYWHEASVIWAPSSEQDIKVSIINLPLEDYYNIAQIEAIKELLIEIGTIQTDWLAKLPTITIDGRDYDNPAYLRNKPVTGVSLLSGGNWSELPLNRRPDFIVSGGNFNDIEKDASHTFLAPTEEYKNAVTILYHGKQDDLPPANEHTRYALKYCTDTGNLYLDAYGHADGYGNTVDELPGLIKGNYLIRSVTEMKFIAAMLLKPSTTDSAPIGTYVSDTNQTNIIEVTGKRGIDGRLEDFKWFIQATGAKRVRFNKTSANVQGDFNIEIDIFVQDILDRLTALEDRCTAIEQKNKEQDEADIALGKRIDTEAEIRKRTDEKLQNAINGLHEVDVEIYGRIEAEERTRENADIALGKRIDDLIAHTNQAIEDEKNARIANDTALGQKIDKEIQDREAADTAEAQVREQKDEELRALIMASLPIVNEVTVPPTAFIPNSNSGLSAVTVKAYKYGRYVQLNIKVTKPAGTDASQFILKNIPTSLWPAIDECAGIFHYGGADLLGTASFFTSSGQSLLKVTPNPNKLNDWKGYNTGNIDITYISKE